MIEREQILTCSVFDTIRLLGSKESDFNETVVVVLHKTDSVVYGVVQQSGTQITFAEDFDPRITHFEFVTNIVDTEIVVEEVITEKVESDVLYLDETVYSELFNYISEHAVYSKLSLEKREHMTKILFQMLKFHQDRDDKFVWKKGVRPPQPLHVRLADTNGFIHSRFARPIVRVTKDKMRNTSTVDFLDNTQKPLEHVCSSIPKLKTRVQYIRTYEDDNLDQINAEYIVRESLDYVLRNNPLEQDFQYRNMYKSGKHTACNSQGGNDRLYYTDLSISKKTATSQEPTNEIDFARVLYYPYIRQREDTNDPILVEEYSFSSPDSSDNVFHQRFEETYLKEHKDSQYVVHPLRQRYVTLASTIESVREKNGQVPPNLINTLNAKKLEDIVSLSKILKRHTKEIRTFSSVSQLEALLSRYNIESNNVLSDKDLEMLYKGIQTRVDIVADRFNVAREKSTAIIESHTKATSLLADSTKIFMSLVQNKSPYLDINKALSRASAKLRELQISSKREIDVNIDPDHMYAWLYTSLCQAHEYSAYFDHIYGDVQQPNRSNETLSSLVQTVLSVYGFQDTQAQSPVRFTQSNQTLLSACDVRNMKALYTLMKSSDSGRLFTGLLRSRQDFDFIVRLKDELLKFGKKRFTHKYRSGSTTDSEGEDNKPSWEDLTEDEKLEYSPNKQFVQNLFKSIVQPLLETFRSAPRGLCSGHNVVKVYSSIEELQQDVNAPRTDTSTTFAKNIMRTLQSQLEGKQGNDTLIDDDMFDRIYYDITNRDRMRVRQSRLVRPGEYASVKNMNVLFQWTGSSWLKEEIDIQNEMNQCPYNFGAINEIDWSGMMQELNGTNNDTIESLCVYEDRLQECLPYPLYRMFQFIIRVYARYHEIASSILNIETKYARIVSAMQAAVSQNPIQREIFHKKQTTLEGVQTEPLSEQLDDILRRILQSDLFSDAQLFACNQLMGFVQKHRDNSRTSEDGFVYWNFSHSKMCGHWLTFAGAFVQNPALAHSSSIDERIEMLHTFSNKWACDVHGYCMHCGTSLSHLKDNAEGTEWEQLHDGKEAVAVPGRTSDSVPSIDAVLATLSPEDRNTKRKIKAFVDMFGNTMGLSAIDEEFSVLCTNMILPRVTVQSYETFTKGIVDSDPKIEKRKATIEKDRQKYAALAGADPEFFHKEDRSLLSFFKRQAPREKVKKQKRIRKHIQALEWLESYYQNYVEEQHTLAVLGALYIHISLRSPAMTIRKKDSMSDVRISMRTFSDLVGKKYSFVKTMSVTLQKVLATPAVLEWPSERTRQRMSAKIKQEVARGTGRDSASYRVYGSIIISYLEQVQSIYPYFETLKEKKATEEEQLHKDVTKSLSSYRPIYDRSRLAYNDPINALMTSIEKTLNSADIIPYSTSSCVFPYVQDPSISHPYMYSLLGKIPKILIEERARHANGQRRLFVPLQRKQKTQIPYITLDEHTQSYMESRYTAFMQKYASTGEKRTYRPLQVSDSLRHLTQYKEFLDNDPLSSSYHPAIVRALQENDDEIHRDLHYRDGAQFKTNDAVAISLESFQERIMARRMNQICKSGQTSDKEKVKSFQEQFHTLCSLWTDVDNAVISELRLESMPDKEFFRAISKERSNNTAGMAKDRQSIIARFERIIENECKQAGGLGELRQMIRPSEIQGGQVLKLGQLLACISAYLSSTIHASWTPLIHHYEPVSGKDAESFLQQETLAMRTLHTTSFDIHRNIIKRFEDRYIDIDNTKKAIMIQPISGAVRAIQSMHLSEYDKEQIRYLYLLCLYMVVNLITVVRSSLSSLTAHALIQTILQLVRESDMIQNLGTSDVQEMQQYIDQKNNASRVRFIERLKVIDPALENSHYMFRRNNLGKVAHVDFSNIDENEKTNTAVLDDTTWMEISNEEEGYTTLLDEE